MQSTSKPRDRKPKVADSTSDPSSSDAPPPYVDDGSHDILQEVLAIEREKVEKRIRSTSEKERDKYLVNGTSGKRKKTDTLSEDDILALATPAKKERPSPPGPSTVVGKVKVSVLPTTKPVPASHKAKVDKPESVRPSISDIPKISIKGKEKELSISAPPPGHKPKKFSPQSTPVNEKKCKELIKSLQKLPEAAIFAHPVDPIGDGCPT